MEDDPIETPEDYSSHNSKSDWDYAQPFIF